jgi:hypothetical protein
VAFRTYSLSLPKQPLSTHVILDSTIVNILSQTDLIITHPFNRKVSRFKGVNFSRDLVVDRIEI